MKKIITYLVLTLLFIGGLYIYTKESAYSPVSSVNNSSQQESINPNATTTPQVIPSKTFTVEDVKTHNTAESCYAIINGSVYDLTTWINKHPGGKLAILAICGRDGSTAFNLQHGGASKPNAKLTTFKIGTVGQTSSPVACTMDAKMCPDGTYVGRSGPNCQFVCK